MKTAVKYLAILLLAISASTVVAEPGKWYIGIGAGQSRYNDWISQGDIANFKDEFGASLGVVNFDGVHRAYAEDIAVGYKLFAGYSFHKNIAVEFSYIDMGEVDADSYASGTFYDLVDNSLDGDLYATAKAGVNAFTLDVNLNIPIISFAAIIIKGGAYAADTNVELSAGSSISTENYNYSKTDSSTGLHYGIGVHFEITDAIGLRAEWERLDQIEANNGKNDIDLLSASLIYSF
jgi:opacity protein-like surface antigen